MYAAIDVGKSDGIPRRLVRKDETRTETIVFSRFNVPVMINPPR